MMDWNQLYGPDSAPTEEQISDYIHNALWPDINAYLCRAYGVEPFLSYSGCSAQKGWNIKYRKAGRSLCTLYPMEGYFIALVLLGEKERMEAELALRHCSAYVREVYEKAGSLNGSRWMMIDVADEAALADVKRLISIRRPVKEK